MVTRSSRVWRPRGLARVGQGKQVLGCSGCLLAFNAGAALILPHSPHSPHSPRVNRTASWHASEEVAGGKLRPLEPCGALEPGDLAPLFER